MPKPEISATESALFRLLLARQRQAGKDSDSFIELGLEYDGTLTAYGKAIPTEASVERLVERRANELANALRQGSGALELPRVELRLVTLPPLVAPTIRVLPQTAPDGHEEPIIDPCGFPLPRMYRVAWRAAEGVDQMHIGRAKEYHTAHDQATQEAAASDFNHWWIVPDDVLPQIGDDNYYSELARIVVMEGEPVYGTAPAEHSAADSADPAAASSGPAARARFPAPVPVAGTGHPHDRTGAREVHGGTGDGLSPLHESVRELERTRQLGIEYGPNRRGSR